MRCTSSDLIIAAAVPGLTERIAPPLVRDWRVPKGQETVKVETLHRLHRAPLFQPPRERAQTDRLEGRDHGGVQERQVAEPVAQPIVAHRRRRIDVLFLRQPRKRGSLVADLVDELERDTLPAGKDATVGHALQRRVVEVAARLHHAAEPGIGVRDDRLDGRARLRRGRFEAVGRRLERRRLDFFDLDAERLQKIGDVRILKQHADRADQGGLQRDDVIGRDRRNVTARSRQPVDHDDQRLLLFEPHQRVVQLLGARRGAAGGIDVHDHGPRARFPKPLQRLHPLQIGADEAGDGDAGDRSARPPDQYVGAGRAQRGADRDYGADGNDDRADAPEGELAPHAATIDDRIGIERHGSPLLDSSGLAFLSLFLLLGRLFLLGGLFRCALERGAEDVAERRPRIGGAVLGDRLLLFRHFERLDRDLHLVGAAVELGDAGVDFLPDRETLRPLLAAIARQLGALDEGGEVAADDLHLDAGVLHLGHLAGHDRALLEIAGALHGIVCELLDAQRNALLLDIDVEHLGLDLIAFLVLLDHLLARPLPVEVGEVDHAVDVAVEAEEEPELGLVLDLALEHGAGRILLDEDLPRIAHGLLEPERDAPLDRIDLEDLHLHLLGGGYDLARVHVLLGPRHLGHVDESLDAGLELHERAVVGDVGDAALEARADGIFGLDALPRVVLQLLHAERDAVGLVVDLDDLDLHLLADIEHLGGMIDAPPSDVGDVQKPVDAAEIHECAVIGDVLDHAVDDLTFFEILHQFLALFGARLFEHGAARHHDVAAAAIHFQDLERLRLIHQRRHVADRPDIDLAARQERHRPVEVDGEAALDLIEDDALDLFVAVEGLFQLAPALLAPRLVAREHGFAERVLHPLEIDLDRVADLDVGLPARSREFAQRDASLGLGADVDDGEILLDADDRPLDDGALLRAALGKGLFEHFREIFARRRGGTGGGGHEHSLSYGWRRIVVDGVSRAGAESPRDLRQPPQGKFCAGCNGLRATVRACDPAVKTMISCPCATKEAGGAGSTSTDGNAVSRVSGLLGRLRRCRWRPGTRRLYPNAWCRASALPAPLSGGRPPAWCRARPGAGCRPRPRPR